MRGWRGAMAAKLPGSLLRAVADGLKKKRVWEPGHAFVTSAETLRERNQSALRMALEADGIVAGHGRRAGKPTFFLPRPELPPRRDLESFAGRAGLSILGGTPMREGARFHINGAETSGRADVDRALAALLVAHGEKKEPEWTDVLEPDFDVDLVYTWVDGDDPAWRETRAAMSDAEGGLPSTSADVGRFTSHDELRYSLRSVAYFAPWVRRIHLVTAGQVPPWLNTFDDRIQVVDHTEIFTQPENLPTFNSHAIESQLHRIPGLAEHFVYMNDDVFFGQPVGPGDFFTPSGQTRFFLSTNEIRTPGTGELPVDIAARNNRGIIERRFGKTTSRKFLHSPHAQRRSTLELLESEQELAVAATAAARFRSATDLSIPSSLAHYYGLALGAAVPADIDYAYVDISVPQAQIQLLRLMRRTPMVFCLNEVEALPGRHAEVSRMLEHFLQSVFPVPSGFEKATGNPGSAAAGPIAGPA